MTIWRHLLKVYLSVSVHIMLLGTYLLLLKCVCYVYAICSDVHYKILHTSTLKSVNIWADRTHFQNYEKNILSRSFVYSGNVQYTRKSINLDTFSSIDLPILHKPATVATYACLEVVLTSLKIFQFRVKTQLTSVLNAEKSAAIGEILKNSRYIKVLNDGLGCYR